VAHASILGAFQAAFGRREAAKAAVRKKQKATGSSSNGMALGQVDMDAKMAEFEITSFFKVPKAGRLEINWHLQRCYQDGDAVASREAVGSSSDGGTVTMNGGRHRSRDGRAGLQRRSPRDRRRAAPAVAVKKTRRSRREFGCFKTTGGGGGCLFYPGFIEKKSPRLSLCALFIDICHLARMINFLFSVIKWLKSRSVAGSQFSTPGARCWNSQVFFGGGEATTVIFFLK
jgi:hypothetical protein